MSRVSGCSLAQTNATFGIAKQLPLETLGGLKLICSAFAYVKMFNFMTSVMNPEVIDVQLAFI